jgi:RNA polymerase sigma-70 factor, ECF subfamily
MKRVSAPSCPGRFDTVVAMSLQNTSLRSSANYASESAQIIGKDDPSPIPEKTKQLNGCATFLDCLRSGHGHAYEELVRKFGGRLLAVARRYLRSEADASDAVQNAFLCAFKSIDTFKGDSRLSTWLHRIVVNCALMHLRASRRHPETDKLDIDNLLPQLNITGNWIEHGLLTPPAYLLVEASEARAIVRQCIDLLPDNYRTILILRDIDELDTEEAARMLNLSPSATKVRLHRAHQALKALLEKHKDLVTN